MSSDYAAGDGAARGGAAEGGAADRREEGPSRQEAALDEAALSDLFSASGDEKSKRTLTGRPATTERSGHLALLDSFVSDLINERLLAFYGALGERKQRVLRSVADGKNYREVGDAEGISRESVRLIVEGAKEKARRAWTRPEEKAARLEAQARRLKARAQARERAPKEQRRAETDIEHVPVETRRAQNVLQGLKDKEGLRTAGDLLLYGRARVADYRGCGAVTLRDIDRALSQMGLDLQREGWVAAWDIPAGSAETKK